MDDEGTEVDHEVVIVGAGISGLATALALHRKGIKSVVLERSETLRSTTGTAIGIRPNGWRALDQLGVADTLRQTAFPIEREQDVWLDKDQQQQGKPMVGENRCLRRSDLVNTLSSALPPGTIHFGHQIVSVNVDPQTNFPKLQLHGGRSMVMKVLIGCDGGNSVVADYLDLKPTKVFGLCGVRGLANYPKGHALSYEFVRMRKNKNLVGRIPIDDKLVYWFVALKCASADANIWREPEQIRRLTLEAVKDFPPEIEEMIKSSDLESLSFTHLRYRAPWDLLMATFCKGTVTVAGDAMHIMGPFLGQGGAAGLEDAVVLARSLAHKLSSISLVDSGKKIMVHNIGDALEQYVKARKTRVVRLSTQTYLTGALLESSSLFMKFVCILLMIILFRDQSGHTKYDCGTL